MTAAASWAQSRVPSSLLDNVAAMEHQAAHFKPFAHLTAPNSGLYRRVMLAFVAAKRRFVVHLRGSGGVAPWILRGSRSLCFTVTVIL